MSNPFGRLMSLARRVAGGQSKPHFTVFDVKRQSLNSLNKSDSHEQRTAGDLSHVDEKRTHLNERGGYNGNEDSPKKAVHDYLRDKNVKIDKRNTTPVTTFVLSASPEYFEMADGKAGTANPEKLEAWKKATSKWVRDNLGDDVVHMSLHLDEKTPHFHIHMVPTYEKKTKRKTVTQASHHQHAFFKGKKSYERCLDTYADAVAHLGIERGQRLPEGARGSHRTAREWVNDMARKMADAPRRVAALDVREAQISKKETVLANERADLKDYQETLDQFAGELMSKAKTVSEDGKRTSTAITNSTLEMARQAPKAPAPPKRTEKRTRRAKTANRVDER